MTRPRKLIASMSAPRRAKICNRYYDEFRTAILSELGNIQSYRFCYIDATDPSINAIIHMRESATAADRQALLHQLQYAFTDIDNTSFTVTKDAESFMALAAQCDDADDDDDDDDDDVVAGEDDDDGDFDGNDDDDQDATNVDDEDGHGGYSFALTALMKYTFKLLTICAPESWRPLAAHNITALANNQMRSVILPCLIGVEQVIRRRSGAPVIADNPDHDNDAVNDENADDEVDDDDDDDVDALSIEVGYARPYSDAERSKFHRVE